MSDAYEEPLAITPVRDAVIVTHPQSAGAWALTPEAAILSAARLVQAAELAKSGALPPLPED